MRIAEWNEYELLDTSAGERLERWGDWILIRPDPQILWDTPKRDPRWKTLINPKTFLGDAAFDTIEIYKALLDDLGLPHICK